MPKLTNRIPKYRLHKPSGKAVVTLGGQDFYLGKHGTAASKAEYNRLVGEWVAKGRPSVITPAKEMMVNEVILAYVRFAAGYYRKNGKPTDELACIKAAARHVQGLYARTPAANFGPLALEAVRRRMIETGNTQHHEPQIRCVTAPNGTQSSRAGTIAAQATSRRATTAGR